MDCAKLCLNSSRMVTIRNNKINFAISNDAARGERKYSLIGGSFHIIDHKITFGQPSSNIRNGDILFCDSSGQFNFEVGRKASNAVATWFNEKCNPSSNTFGHKARKLNFAFLGTLQLTISRELQVYTIVFDNILLAQGSSCSNTWWFGGKTCFKIKNHCEVISKGRTKNNNNFAFNFLRGNNTNVHTVEITNIILLTWMNNIEESKLLSQINLPGSHDSATYNYKNVFLGEYVKTQNLSITEQLNLGIRYLDIRCRHINNIFAIHHGRVYVNLNFNDILKQCILFLNENESESIIMLIKEEYNPKGNTREFYETFLDYADKCSEYWYHNNTIPSIKEAKKKIVLLYRFDFKEKSFGINCTDWKDNETFVIENIVSFSKIQKLMIQDEYAVPLGLKLKAIKKLAQNSNRRENFWYLNYISLSSTFNRNIIQTSYYINDVIYQIAKFSRGEFLGFIIMDYPNLKKGLTSHIIDKNFI